MSPVRNTRWLSVAFALVFTCLGVPLQAAVISIINSDGPGEGFNDPTPVSPVGGNTGTTLGQQRLIVFQKAAEFWGNQLQSAVPVQVRASFDPLPCNAFGAVLGAAGPVNVFRDFAGALVPNTYYPSALANALAGQDLDPTQPDIDAYFSSTLGQAGCLPGVNWYYGLDNNLPFGGISLLDTVKHELAHGLGFLTLVDVNTGAKFLGFDDHYMRFLEDHRTGRTFPVMTDAERLSAQTSFNNLHWTGSNVVARSSVLTAGKHPTGHVQMYAPNPPEPGSSVSHFDTALVPDELMEPFATSTSISTLTLEAFRDMGWPVVPQGTPSLSIGNVTVAEGNSGTTNAVFTVTLSSPFTNQVTVRYATSNNTAVAGFDFFGASGTLTFAPGSTIQTIPVAVLGDLVIEGNETFLIQLFSPTNAILSQSQGVGTILNDDGPTFVVSDVSVAEGDSGFTNAVFQVTLTTTAAGTVSVQVFTADGTATSGVDYFPTNGTLFFPSGVRTQLVSVVVFGDGDIETDETLFLNLTNATGASIFDAQGVATIVDEDSRLIVDDTGVIEGNSGTTNAVFTVRLTKPATNVVTVGYSTASRTAVAGIDFVATSGLLSFPVGATNATLSVPVIGDLLNELDETFVVNLSNPTNSFITRGQAACVITNDDGAPGVFITNSVSVVEGNAGTVTNAAVTVFLSEPSGRIVTVDYATGVGSASSGADYTSSSGTIVFPTNTTSRVILIPVLGDNHFEADESFTVRISNPRNATNVVSQETATVTIVNDDPDALIGITDVAVFEGNAGADTLAVFHVTLNVSSGVPVSVSYTNTDLFPTSGFAEKGLDYLGTNGLITFAPGETVKPVTVIVKGDSLIEPNEAFFVDLSGAVNGIIARSRGIGTILNDDGPILKVEDVVVVEGNSGTTNAVFTVSLVPAADATVNVNYATSNITATAGLDYVAASGPVTFTPGQTSASVSVPVQGETFLEADETFALILSSAVNATIGRAVGVATIKDDDTLADLELTMVRSSLVGTGVTNYVGHYITNYIAVTNKGPLGASNVVVSNIFSTGVTLVSWTNSQGAFTAVEGAFTFNLGTLTTNSGASAMLVVAPGAAGTMTHLASVSATQPDTNLVNNLTNLTNTVLSPQVVLTAEAGLTLVAEGFSPANGSYDPAEFVTVALSLKNTGNVASTNVTASLREGGGVHGPGAAQSYGVIAPGGTVSKSFNFTANTVGGDVIATFDLADGAVSLGSISFTNRTGVTSSLANAASITVPEQGAALAYPSTIEVSGLVGVINKVSVTLSNLSHAWPADLDILLVSPSGQKVLLLSDVGGGNAVSGLNLTFSDSAAAALAEFAPIASGAYKPSAFDAGSDLFPAPAPAAPYASVLSEFAGSTPNGTWSLYVLDDANGDAGVIAGGWSLSIETVSPVNTTAALSVSVVANPNPVRQGSNLTYSITVSNLGPATATSVMLTNVLPFQSQLVSIPGVGPESISSLDGAMVISLGKILSGNATMVQIVVTNNASGTATNVATVAAVETDLNLADNMAVNTTRIDRVMALQTPALSLTNGQFAFSLVGQAGLTYVIEVSTNLVHWTPIQTNFTGSSTSISVVDTNGAAGGVRFYRAVER